MLGKQGAGTCIEAEQNGAVFVAADVALDPAHADQPLTSGNSFHRMQTCTWVNDDVSSWKFYMLTVLNSLNA